MSNGILSRREFLKLGSATLLSVLLADLKLDPVQAAPAPHAGTCSGNQPDRPGCAGIYG